MEVIGSPVVWWSGPQSFILNTSAPNTHQLWGKQLNRNRIPSPLLLFTPWLWATRRTAPLHLQRERGGVWGSCEGPTSFSPCS